MFHIHADVTLLAVIPTVFSPAVKFLTRSFKFLLGWNPSDCSSGEFLIENLRERRQVERCGIQSLLGSSHRKDARCYTITQGDVGRLSRPQRPRHLHGARVIEQQASVNRCGEQCTLIHDHDCDQ